jgi:hypothetical protein
MTQALYAQINNKRKDNKGKNVLVLKKNKKERKARNGNNKTTCCAFMSYHAFYS